ncbi:MAG TPA: beta-L-arabinofuranosidase domain-containing protein, partial [Planctomycetota bacterium]|nr:beta-L-arabinofuranosidase domain-containing protein [Planctomycetota bacterium]
MIAGGLLWAAGILLAAGAEGPLALDAPPGVRLTFRGPIGERIERNIDNWLLVAPSANPGMLEMFRVRDRKPEPRLVPWAGEFAGKYLISAVEALRLTEREDLRRQVERFVKDLIATQAEDGYLGPFPLRDRLRGNWDLWGHYHVMLGLLLWHEHSGDTEAFKAVGKAADLICDIYLDTGRRVIDAGSPEMNMAVIHVLGCLHRLTGNERWLRMMREIEKDWEAAGDYFRQGLAGVEFHRTPRPRWESLHDLQGLVELFRITGDERYRTAFVNLWRSIARRDRHNTGGFSSGEQAIGHPYSPAPIETCCTIAWMAITIDMLRITGEPAAADELELSTWNGMLGAQHPSGRWWTYSTPMDGVREASAHSIVFQSRAGTPELNCCSVNGPRGLGMLSEWAVMTAPGVIVLNWNDGLRAEVKLPDGLRVTLETLLERTGLETTVEPEREAAFELRIRIPAWSERTEVRLSTGERLPSPVAGSYFSISRRWRSGDKVTLRLDRRLRVVAGDREAAGKVSIYRGPFLLAYDQRLNAFDEDAIPVLDARALEEMLRPLRLLEKSVLEPLELV